MDPPELDFSPPFHSTRRLKQNHLFKQFFDSIRRCETFHTLPSPVVISRLRNLRITFLRARQLHGPNCYNLLLNNFIGNERSSLMV